MPAVTPLPDSPLRAGASSVMAHHLAALAVDGDPGTRWVGPTKKDEDTVWLLVDLGGTETISEVNMIWDPELPPAGSQDPMDLYDYLEAYEKKTNGSIMALAHNGNLSNGIMFPTDRRYNGDRLNKEYVEARAKWERH